MSDNKLTTLSGGQFQKREKEAIERQPLRRDVHVSELEIIDDEKITYKGQPLKVTPKAFSDLMKLLNMPIKFIKKFGEATQSNPEAKRKLIGTIKRLMSTTGTSGSKVCLVLSVETKEIVAITKNSRNLISNDNFLKTVKNVMSNNKLETVDFSISGDGDVTVNTVDTDSQFGIEGLKDEVFTGGITFMNSPQNGFVVTPYINRMWCANGMSSTAFSETHKLLSTDTNAMQKFYHDMAELAKNGYKPDIFVERVREARQLKASLAEMYSVKQRIKNVCKDITPEEMESWVPVKYTEAAYHRINIDTKLLNKAQLKNASTNTSVWELINGLTHFASHDHGFNASEYELRALQVEAGALLTNEHDMANFVRNPWSTNINKEDHYQARNAY